MSATIYANFIADPRGQARQVDFLVLTPRRLTHVELKTVARDSRIHAVANGHWRQTLPGGHERAWRNAYRQAHDATYAISDDVHRLVRQGMLPSLNDRFFRFIDTVVCLFPGIPPGSDVEGYKYVTACGYETLLERLATPGPRPPGWTGTEAESLARQLNLFAEPADIRGSARRTQDLNVLAQYRSRYIQAHELGLHELVAVAAVDESDNQVSPIDVIVNAIRDGEAVTFTGASGGGKSHAVRHAALQSARNQAAPIWLRCADYEGDTFAVAMAKGAARFTSGQWHDLFARARRHGIMPVIVLDGLNECSPNQQRLLLEGAASYQNTAGCALLVTAQERVPLPGAHDLRTATPTAEERATLLASYGAPSLLIADAFRTPWELAMAADCASELHEDSGPVDVLELYVRRRTASERQREQIRALAIAMQRSLQLSLPLGLVRTLIGDLTDRLPTADELDDIFQCPLLDVGALRMAFTHESLGQFLAAEQLVHSVATGSELAEALAEPALHGLREMVIAVAHDSRRQGEVLVALSDPSLIASAARGRYGAATQTLIHAEMRAALQRAAPATERAVFAYIDDRDHHGLPFGGQWSMPSPLARSDQALMTACGLCLPDGVLLPEVCHLLDATDAHCSIAIEDLRQRGVASPVSVVVAATFTTSMRMSGATDLPATLVLRACADGRHQWKGAEENAPRALHVRYASQGPALWGRMLAALLVLNVESDEDLALMPQLVEEAWRLHGYHLQLEVLSLARAVSWRLDPSKQDEFRGILESLDVQQNWALSSLLVEALAACGGIEPLATAEAIHDDISRALSEPFNPEACAFARSILGNQFEDASIFGPYAEVVDELAPSDLVALCGMSLRHNTDADISSTRDWAVARVADHMELAGPEIRQIVADIAGAPPLQTFMAYEGLRAHVGALRGWAKIADHLPEAGGEPGDLAAGAWHLIDELVFLLLRNEDIAAEHADVTWKQLCDLYRPHAVDALLQLRKMQWWDEDGAESIYLRMARTYPDQFRGLYEWALQNWDDVQPSIGDRLLTTRVDAISELSRSGDANTQTLLRGFIDDPELASAAIEAIRAIARRRA